MAVGLLAAAPSEGLRIGGKALHVGSGQYTTDRLSEVLATRIYHGSMVKQASDSSVAMWTASEFKARFGRTFDNDKDFIAVMNGDANGIPVHVESVSYMGGTLYAVFDRAWSGSIRITWLALIGP